MSELELLCKKLEELEVRFNEETYKRYAGFEYDEALLKDLSNKILDIQKEIVKKFKEPRRLYLSSIYGIAEAAKLEDSLKLYEARNKEITAEKFKIGDTIVNWSSWRQFNASTDDHTKRKEVFDTFIQKVPKITPLIENLFKKSKEIINSYGEDPLNMYLEFEGLSYAQLEELVNQLGSTAKPHFQKALEYYSKEILGKPAEYYDDFYLFRGKIYKPINKYFKDVDPVEMVHKALTKLGFDLSKIKVDGEDRPKKYPSAVCFGIQIPNDVRILFKPVSPFTDLTSVFHEFGHGIHDSSANPDDPYWTRYLISMGVAETFSILSETLMETPDFLKYYFKFSDEIIQDIVNRRHFMNLFFLTFYSANALMKLHYWKFNYTMEQADEEYEKLTEKFMGIRVPGKYWQLHHIMSDSVLYAPSYLIAAVRVGEFINYLEKTFGNDWWINKEAGEFIQQLARQRADVVFPFSKLDPKYYFEYHTKVEL